ncbi:thiamine biosynthesis protein ThiS [Parvularcula lutaonensis]|nr:thiamine biosynthesis protein ThiS [Parvularcula lutaonensis]
MPLGTSVADLLAHLGIVGGKVAVERNRAIVARSSFDTQMLQDGDVIEIVRFVGGG